jgi:hypothetical protein
MLVDRTLDAEWQCNAWNGSSVQVCTNCGLKIILASLDNIEKNAGYALNSLQTVRDEFVVGGGFVRSF